MKKKYGYKYFSGAGRQANFKKKISSISGLLFVIQMSFGSLFFIGLPLNIGLADAGSDENMCEAPVDVVLLLDRSGSMYDGTCTWYNNEGQIVTEYMTKTQCYLGVPPGYKWNWKAYEPSKLEAAQEAANSFLSFMGTNDQSALVSFSDNAVLDQTLTHLHSQTEAAVNGLTAGGATNIGEAIEEAITELDDNGNPHAARVMILLTDGKANKPNGDGFGENQDDVDYAEEKADEAAAKGYKIYTIGLGSEDDINKDMLDYIAGVSGAESFYSLSAGDLQDIYNSIALRICELGSISGYKYEDTDNDGDISDETNKLSGWKIVLNNSEHQVQYTDSEGYYQFSGLNHGTYIISEEGPGDVDFIQTYPSGGSHTVVLEQIEGYITEHAADVNFGNYLVPEAGTGTLTICKQEDLNGNGQLDAGEPTVTDHLWTFSIEGLGDFTAATSGCAVIENLDFGAYTVSEESVSGWLPTGVTGSSTGNGVFTAPDEIEVNVQSTGNTIIYFLNQQVVEEEDDGTITIRKDAGESVAQFGFNSNYLEPFNLASGEEKTTIRLADGIYHVYEGVIPAGWNLDRIECTGAYATWTDDGNGIYIELIGQDNNAVCTFYNIYQEEPACQDGDTRPCYSGPSGTEGVGVCQSGTQTCENGVWGDCEGEILPSEEICDGLDNDCDGTVDEGVCGGPSPKRPFCGDGTCDEGENCENCPEDCSCQGPTFFTYTNQGANASLPSSGQAPTQVLGEEGGPALSISKSASLDMANPGDKGIAYNIVVVNNGSLDAFNVIISDTLPEGMTYSEDKSSEKTWEIGDLAPGASKEVSFTVDIAEDAPAGVLTNTAIVSADNSDELSDSADIEIVEVEVLAETGFLRLEFSLLLLLLAGAVSGLGYLYRRAAL